MPAPKSKKGEPQAVPADSGGKREREDIPAKKGKVDRGNCQQERGKEEQHRQEEHQQEQAQGHVPSSMEQGLSWVEFLRSSSCRTTDHDTDTHTDTEQACHGLGKLAAQDAETRDRVLSWGTLDVLLQVLSESCGDVEAHTSVCQGATWAVAQLCRGEPRVKLQLVEAAIPVLVSLLNHPNESVSVEAARTIGDVVAGRDEEMTKAVVTDAGALPKFRSLLCHPEEAVRRGACWLLSNVLGGTAVQIQAVIDAKLVPPLLESLQSNEARSVQREAVCAATHLIEYGTEEQRKYFLSIGGLVS